MKRLILLCMCCSLCVAAAAQTQQKTLYNAQKKEVTNEKKAKFYRIVEQRADQVYKVSYYEVNGPLMWDGLFVSIDPYKTIQRNYYFPSGKLKKTEDYSGGVSAVTEYYESGQIMNKFSRNADGLLDGEILSFFDDGTPLRRDSYSAGKLIDGHCFDRSGKEVEHYKFFVDASFNGSEYGISSSFRNLIYTNMNYPRAAMTYMVTGTVYVSFTVKVNGKIDDVSVVFADLEQGVPGNENAYEAAERALKDEALRLVWLCSGWNKPAKINNQPAEVQYVAPVRFMLK